MAKALSDRDTVSYLLNVSEYLIFMNLVFKYFVKLIITLPVKMLKLAKFLKS